MKQQQKFIAFNVHCSQYHVQSKCVVSKHETCRQTFTLYSEFKERIKFGVL